MEEKEAAEEQALENEPATAESNELVGGDSVDINQRDKDFARSTQHTIPIAEIRNGIVILKDGSFRAVIQAEAINFDLMSTSEQESVEYAYQAFLNSLYFPIQIHIQSRLVDAEAYLKKVQSGLEKQRNMLLAVLTEDYVEFLEDLVESTNIISKKFYVIMPFYNMEFNKSSISNATHNFLGKFWQLNKKPSPVITEEKTLEKAIKELRYRSQVVIEGLRNCGVTASPLNTQQLIELYYEFYNPETNISQPLGNFSEIAAPFVSKIGDYRSPGTDSEDNSLDQEASAESAEDKITEPEPIESPPPVDRPKQAAIETPSLAKEESPAASNEKETP